MRDNSVTVEFICPECEHVQNVRVYPGLPGNRYEPPEPVYIEPDICEKCGREIEELYELCQDAADKEEGLRDEHYDNELRRQREGD